VFRHTAGPRQHIFLREITQAPPVSTWFRVGALTNAKTRMGDCPATLQIAALSCDGPPAQPPRSGTHLPGLRGVVLFVCSNCLLDARGARPDAPGLIALAFGMWDACPVD
jgi:hypothetical protein